MATDHPEHRAGTLDYKTLFAGAAVLVSLLGGAFWSVWNKTTADNIDALSVTNVQQWERLREFNDALIEMRTRQVEIRRETDDQEVRIRELERAAHRR